MMNSNPIRVVEGLMSDLGDLLLNDEEVVGLIATTNASGWGMDTYENLKVQSQSSDEIGFLVDIILDGEQHLDEPFCGSSAVIRVEGEVFYQDGEWDIKDTYRILDLRNNLTLDNAN